ncbi:MAG: DUF1552 domain-containing protein [Myxococcota bacterium]
MTTFDRRRALKLLAATTVGSSIPWFKSSSAFAQGAIPLRLLHVDLATGFRRGTWEPSARGSGPVFSGDDWQFGGAYAPLERYKSMINLFENLDMVSTRRDPTSPSNAHINGTSHQLTANNRLNGDGSLAGSISIDQLVADSINRTPVTRLRSFEIAGREHGNSGYASFSGPGQRLSYETNPDGAYRRLFPEPVAGTDERSARNAAIFDLVRSDFDRLMGRLGTEDREKIQQLRDLRSDLESRRSLGAGRDTFRPPESVLDPYRNLNDRYQAGNLNNRRWSVKVDAMVRLAAAAIHTDTTRVVSLVIDNPPDYEFGYTNGQWGTQGWHDLDHAVSGDSPSLTHPDAQAAIGRMQRMRLDKFIELLDLLAELREPDGSSLLDHTLVLVTSHIAEGSHDVTRLPWFVVGNAHGQFRTGQLIRFPLIGDGDPNNASHRIYRLHGRHHGDLLATVARAMGVDVDRFGNPDVAQGTIDAMWA